VGPFAQWADGTGESGLEKKNQPRSDPGGGRKGENTGGKGSCRFSPEKLSNKVDPGSRRIGNKILKGWGGEFVGLLRLVMEEEMESIPREIRHANSMGAGKVSGFVQRSVTEKGENPVAFRNFCHSREGRKRGVGIQ